MKEIILDESLTAGEIDHTEFKPEYFFNDVKGFELVTSFTADIRHRNYLEYVGLCWKRHYGVVISPTILWNMVLNNLAFEVNKNPEIYRSYFTESDEKQEIMVNQDGNLIDVDLLISGVKGKIPADIMEDMFPEFTTDSDNAIIANYTAFLDMVSPYYNYSMFLCGIPKVKVLGTYEDWQLFSVKLGEIVSGIPEFKEYLEKIRDRISSIVEKTADYSDFFRLDRCGSGGEVEVKGWITDFFIEIPRVTYPENFISCIAKIDYHCYTDNCDYRMYAGLFTSKIDDGYLIPEFDNIYFKKGE